MIEELTLGIVSTCLPETAGGRFRKTLLPIQSSLLAVTLPWSSVLSIFTAIASTCGCNSARLHRSHQVQPGQSHWLKFTSILQNGDKSPRERALETIQRFDCDCQLLFGDCDILGVDFCFAKGTSFQRMTHPLSVPL